MSCAVHRDSSRTATEVRLYQFEYTVYQFKDGDMKVITATLLIVVVATSMFHSSHARPSGLVRKTATKALIADYGQYLNDMVIMQSMVQIASGKGDHMNIKLSKEQADCIKKAAAKKGISVSEFIRKYGTKP